MMSSAFAMVLVAAMAVTGNGPEMVSEEVEPTGLDLSGEWKGVWLRTDGTEDKVTVSQGIIAFESGAGPLNTSYIADEGNSNCRLSVNRWVMLGIYHQDNERVMICFRDRYDNKRPASLKRTNEDHLLILHRVKPRN